VGNESRASGASTEAWWGNRLYDLQLPAQPTPKLDGATHAARPASHFNSVPYLGLHPMRPVSKIPLVARPPPRPKFLLRWWHAIAEEQMPIASAIAFFLIFLGSACFTFLCLSYIQYCPLISEPLQAATSRAQRESARASHLESDALFLFHRLIQEQAFTQKLLNKLTSLDATTAAALKREHESSIGPLRRLSDTLNALVSTSQAHPTCRQQAAQQLPVSPAIKPPSPSKEIQQAGPKTGLKPQSGQSGAPNELATSKASATLEHSSTPAASIQQGLSSSGDTLKQGISQGAQAGEPSASEPAMTSAHQQEEMGIPVLPS
jgi:hypothetical protein